MQKKSVVHLSKHLVSSGVVILFNSLLSPSGYDCADFYDSRFPFFFFLSVFLFRRHCVQPGCLASWLSLKEHIEIDEASDDDDENPRDTTTFWSDNEWRSQVICAASDKQLAAMPHHTTICAIKYILLWILNVFFFTRVQRVIVCKSAYAQKHTQDKLGRIL